MEVAWKKFRHRLEAFAARLFARCIPRLPRRACAAVANALGALAFTLDTRGRTVSLANLAAVFGDRFTERERREIARASYRSFVRTMLDLFWAARLTPENFSRWIKVEGVEVLRGLRERGESAVLMCVHNGGWEWGSLACGFHGFPTQIVAEPFKNSQLSPIFNGLREVSGHRIIAQEASMIRLLKHTKRGGGFAGMLIDLTLRPTQSATVIDAFGMKMCVTFLHAVLAERAGARMVPVDTRLLADGTCRVIIHPPLDIAPDATHRQIAQACWDFYEPIIRENPRAWIWSYKHWRYKPAHTGREYPLYANVSSKFEKLLRSLEHAAALKRKK